MSTDHNLLQQKQPQHDFAKSLTPIEPDTMVLALQKIPTHTIVPPSISAASAISSIASSSSSIAFVLAAHGQPPTVPAPTQPSGDAANFSQSHHTLTAPPQQPGVTHSMDIGVNLEPFSPNADVLGDRDSSYSSTGASQTASLTSSYFNYTYENGRRYASDRFRKADYFLPNDTNEQERLDLYHHIFLLLGGGRLYMAPLGEVDEHGTSARPQMVLDVGTGTGIWAIDFANDHVQAKVIGVDISPIQPVMVPPNCAFEVDDIEEDWVWPRNHFDYIHMRCLAGSIQDWETLLQQAFDHLQPGGIAEYQDYGCEAFFHTGKPANGCATPIAEYINLVTAAADKLGRPLLISQEMKKMMLKVGFVDVHEQTGIWPIGDWPKDKHLKEVGRWTRQAALDSLEPFALQLLRKAENWSMLQVKELCERTKKDLEKGCENKYYSQAWFIWGRKPV